MRKYVDLIKIVATMCASTYTYTIEDDISRVKLIQVEQTFYSRYMYKYVYPFTNMQIMHLDTITRYTDHVINHKLIKHACTSEGAHANT